MGREVRDALTRLCRSCDTTKLVAEFGERGGTECAVCRNRRRRENHLRKKYGISISDFDAILERQRYECAICEAHFSSSSQRFAVDHDHHSGRVRGILCVRCNAALGMLGEDPHLFARALDYLGLA